MKKTILIIAASLLMYGITHAQDVYTQQMQAAVTRLNNANSIKDYQQLAITFERIADAQKTQWLPYYYAAFTNAKIGWLKQNDPDNVEPFANKAEEEIKKAQALLDTSKQKKNYQKCIACLAC